MPTRHKLDAHTRERLLRMLPQCVVLAGELSGKLGDQFVFKPFGLTTPRYVLLYTLMELGGEPNIRQLKDLIMKSQSNLTQMIDLLERDGLVKRLSDPTDRRAYRISITDKGRRLMTKVEEHFRDQVQYLFGEWSDEEIRSGCRFLTQFIHISLRTLGIEDSPCFKGFPLDGLR